MHIEELPNRLNECPSWWRNIIQQVCTNEEEGATDDEINTFLAPYKASVYNLNSKRPWVEFCDEQLEILLKMKMS